MEVGGDTPQQRPYRMTARAEAAQATAERVLDAAVDLFTDNMYDDVTLDSVAARAEVTKRTVLRRFASKEDLFVCAMQRAAGQMMAQRAAAPVDDVPAAVVNVVDHYERWGSNRLRLLSQEDRIAIVAEHVEAGRRFHWSWVERTFAPLLEEVHGAPRQRRIAGLAALTDVYMWKLLRRDLGLTREDTEQILVDLIGNLEGGP
jgi:AcrR family transcriptional regulator